MKRKSAPTSSKSRPVIGIFFDTILDPYEQGIWTSIVKQAEIHDVNLLCFSIGNLLESNQHKSDIVELINIPKIDGFIIITTVFSSNNDMKTVDRFFHKFYSRPCISIGSEIPGIPSIITDNVVGMKELLHHLIQDHGYRKIGFIRGPTSNPEAEIRYETYRKVLKDLHIPFKKDNVFRGDFFIQYRLIDAIDLLSEYGRKSRLLDAIVCTTDSIACDLLQKLKENGIKVPDQIAVTGFDDSEQSRSIIPQLTTVRQSPYELGEKAFALLLDKINGKAIPEKTVLPTRAVIRRSCGCFSYSAPNLIYSNNANKKLFPEKSKKNQEYFIEVLREEIEKRFEEKVSSEKAAEWSVNIVQTAFKDLLFERRKHLLQILEKMIIEGFSYGIDALSWDAVINSLLSRFKILFISKKELHWTEETWKEALRMTGDLEVQKTKREKEDLRVDYYTHYFITEKFMALFTMEELKKSIMDFFPRISFPSCYVSLFSGRSRKKSRLITAYDMQSGFSLEHESKEYPSILLVPADVPLFERRKSFFVRSLFYKNITIGYILIEINPLQGDLYEDFSIQISSAVHSIRLMEKIRKHNRELKKTVAERTEKLLEANKQLKNLDTLKNDFIANITHDFRSPLTVTLNTADLALRYPDPGKAEENYKLIYDSSLKLKNSIDRLLELARMDAQGIKLHISRINLSAFLDGLVRYYNSALMNSGIQIIARFPPSEIEDFYTDTEKLEEVINNIISNAVKFVDTEKGLIEVALRDHKTFAEIVIKDNGIGIPEDKLRSIFNRFEQVHQGRNSLYGGTGIGLAFSRQLIEYLKGEIHAESAGEGKGASFFVRLPKGMDAYKGMEFAEEREAPLKREGFKRIIRFNMEKKTQEDHIQVFFKTMNTDEEFDYRKAVILIIDDDHTICKIVMKYLSGEGYSNFIIANSGKKGLEAVYEYSPHIIISDYNMPDIKGNELHDILRDSPRFKKIPFIFLSAIADRNLIIERREKGASAYLKKPIDEKDLILTIDMHLKNYFEYLKTLQLATIDELTGIHNRSDLLKRLSDELAIRRYRDLSIIFLDVDNFKEFNDKFGHHTGDLILKEIGRLLQNNLRDYDISGRYGGDEFIIILPDTNQEQSSTVAESIRKKIEQISIPTEKDKISVTSSFGITSLWENTPAIEKELKWEPLRSAFEMDDARKADWDKIKEFKQKLAVLLLKMADSALYRAKTTFCRDCSFSSIKANDFHEGKCPKCGSGNLEWGRNRVSPNI